MEDERKFEIVLHAGNAESSAMMAMEAAREGRFDDADSLMGEAETELAEAHRLHTAVLQLAAGGTDIPMDVLLVHAQDHLSMATVLKSVAEESLALNRALTALAQRVASLEASRA